MNKRIRKKMQKGKFWYLKGQMLWQYHVYQSDHRSRDILLCYAVPEGCEFYFKNWKSAKHYLRRMKVFNLMGPTVSYHSPLITCDDIPF